MALAKNQIDDAFTINIWNQTQKNYPHNKTIHALFEEQVAKTPLNIALVYETVQLTYQELNERSNQLAHYLINTYGAKPDTLIALSLERSEFMIIAILAVLKSGCAYVPIDPKYPKERIEFIVQDSHASLLITNEWYQNLYIKISHEHKTNPITDATSAHLAYVIYTSGTTGKPKGVMIEHRGVTNNAVFALSSIYDFTKGNKVTAFASYAFDSSVPEIFSTLLRGGELHILSHELRMDVFKLSDYIDSQHITYLYLPPVLLATLPRKDYSSLNGIIYAGDSCDFNTAQFWSQKLNLYNCYGPTETTVNATYKKIDDGNIKLIGRPIDNVQCYVLDTNLSMQPIGEIGELYIGGVGVARGYLNRPELTAERFVVNPFQTFNEKAIGKYHKLYKTGDLVRWLPDGNLEYIGRTDFQVKIRGFRIELGEIENTLNSYMYKGVPISQSVVIAKERLVAYYVAETKFNHDHIFEYLKNKLPEHMIPSTFVHLKRIPITVHGKIDRNALLEPEWISEGTYLAPHNECEKNICAMWSEILGIPQNQIGVQTDFFRLGGNSILATKLMAKINQYYQSNLSVSDLFLAKTIEAMAIKILQKTSQWQGIICFNKSFQSKNLFMIHPGMGGCEVYIPLVEELSHSFNCYGVDAYNFYHDDKIEDLKILSNYYLNLIDKIMRETNQTDYCLLGWSLGGKIALEMAALLEQKGIKNIVVYLLDTLLLGDVEEDSVEFKKHLMSKGADPAYIEKSLALLPIAQKLHECALSSKLKHTQILLFKALLPSGQKPSDQKVYRYKRSLKYNHVDKCLKSKTQIKVVNMEETHGNMLNQKNILVSEILKFCP